MATTYAEARSLLKSVASQLRCHTETRSEEIPLASAVGRITAEEYVSPITTPTFDSSAMDGFAVVAATTQNASITSPVTLCVAACVVAGDPLCTISSSGDNGFEPCVEIMTGSRFPAVLKQEVEFDAVIKVEDAVVLDVPTSLGVFRWIKITKPVSRNTHKRFAGSDFRKGELVIPSQETIRPNHIMALASVGIEEITVVQKPRIGVWSTGKELLEGQSELNASSQISDANGPFIEAYLQEFGAKVDFLGVIDDNEASFRMSLGRALRSRQYDVLMSTGAVSKGKLDFVPSAIEDMGGTTWFHGVAMRPGHPVLFATLPSSTPGWKTQQDKAKTHSEAQTPQNSVPFFGLPGNPVAVAACVRFLVSPFLEHLSGREEELAIKAKLQMGVNDERASTNVFIKGRSNLDVFQHGHLSIDSMSGWAVIPSKEQSPAKMKPFSEANCWCHIASGHSSSGVIDTVDCFPL